MRSRKKVLEIKAPKSFYKWVQEKTSSNGVQRANWVHNKPNLPFHFKVATTTGLLAVHFFSFSSQLDVEEGQIKEPKVQYFNLMTV